MWEIVRKSYFTYHQNVNIQVLLDHTIITQNDSDKYQGIHFRLRIGTTMPVRKLDKSQEKCVNCSGQLEVIPNQTFQTNRFDLMAQVRRRTVLENPTLKPFNAVIILPIVSYFISKSVRQERHRLPLSEDIVHPGRNLEDSQDTKRFKRLKPCHSIRVTWARGYHLVAGITSNVFVCIRLLLVYYVLIILCTVQ